jgi:hypothetical protein
VVKFPPCQFGLPFNGSQSAHGDNSGDETDQYERPTGPRGGSEGNVPVVPNVCRVLLGTILVLFGVWFAYFGGLYPESGSFPTILSFICMMSGGGFLTNVALWNLVVDLLMSPSRAWVLRA